MDKLDHYRQVIQQTIKGLAELINRHSRRGEVEAHPVLDTERDQYLLVQVGWADRRRVRGTTLYVRIRDDRVWIEEDWTEEGISKALVEAGIPDTDIVLAFQSPQPRFLSEAVSCEAGGRR